MTDPDSASSIHGMGMIASDLRTAWCRLHGTGEISETPLAEILPALPPEIGGVLKHRGDLIIHPLGRETGTFENVALREITPFDVGQDPRVRVTVPHRITGTYGCLENELHISFPDKETSIKGAVGPISGHIYNVTVLQDRMVVTVVGMFGFRKDLEFTW